MSESYALRADDLALLRAAGMSEPDMEHSLRVAEKALDIARRITIAGKASVDMELIGRGALFHDLGKAKTHDIAHGKIGAEMGMALGLPVVITDIMEKHIRGGLSAEEATELGLPVKDYTLRTLEERIVIYADRIVDILWDGIVTVASPQDAEDRFMAILEGNLKYGKNALTLERYCGYHTEIQNLMKAPS